MAKLILMGTGSALSGADRENTYLLVQSEGTNLLIDCAGSPTQRLARLGLSPAEIDHLVLTHNHPDHIYGLTVFMLNAWMAGRETPLEVYGLPETLASTDLMMRAVGADRWPGFFKINYHPVKPDGVAEVLRVDSLTIRAMNTVHFVPTLGLRITNLRTGASVAYSADTSPHPNIVDLAQDAKYLLHEATLLDEPAEGHSTAVEAAEAAERAGAAELILIHLPPQVDPDRWRAAARTKFKGKIHVAQDFDSFEF